MAAARQKGWEQDVAAYIAESLPKLEGPVVATEGVEAAFKPGTAPAGNPTAATTTDPPPSRKDVTSAVIATHTLAMALLLPVSVEID